ncbi:MAG: ROK family protein [Actinomycetota bacterium]
MRIGVDIGGTKIEAVAIDDALSILATFRAPVQGGPRGVAEGAIEAVEKVWRRAEGTPTSIGVGVPGTIRSGVVHNARNLSVHSLDLETAIADATGLPVRVCNDVNAAALGAWIATGATSPSFAYLNLGTGLAAGFVLGGQLLEGSRGGAGEIGYISVDPNGPPDSDGLRGTLETYASGSGVVSQWGVEGATAIDVFLAADRGDGRAETIRTGFYFGAAHAVRVVALAYGADTVVIGGGLTTQADALRSGMRAHFEAWSQVSPLIASLDLDGMTQLLVDERPVQALGAAIVGGFDG